MNESNLLSSSYDQKSESSDAFQWQASSETNPRASRNEAAFPNNESLFIPFFSIPRAEILGDENFIGFVMEINDGSKNEIIVKRYSQFAVLNEALRKRHPEIIFPSFPGKTVFKKRSKEFIEQRRQALERYLQDIIKEDAIRTDPLFRDFIMDRKKLQGKTKIPYWKGKRIVIIGGSSGLGEEIAVQFAGKGNVKLALVARTEDKLLKVAERCKLLSEGVVTKIVVCDATRKEKVRETIEHIASVFGGIDVLVFAVGQGMNATFDEIVDLKLMETMMLHNFYSAVFAAHNALPYLKKSRGHIIVISSLAGVPMQSLYSAAKHALHGFFHSLRLENEEISITIEFHRKLLDAEGKLAEVTLDANKLMSVEECATRIIQGAKQKQREILFETSASIGTAVQTIMPSYVDSRSKKNADAVRTGVDLPK